MNIDNITDIEVLRNLAKSFMVCAAKDFSADFGEDFMFKKGEYYPCEQDQNYIHVFSDDYMCSALLTYDEANDFLEHQ